MKKFIATVFSMKFAGMLLLVFAGVVAAATFIENDLGTSAAKDIVYNALWFEILLFITAISLTGSIFQYKLWRRKKFSVLFFHMAFVVILAGAFVTRNYGYEGIMQIREGESSNEIMTLSPYVQVWLEDGEKDIYYDKSYNFSPYTRNRFRASIPAGDGELKIRYKELVSNAAETIVDDPNGIPIISFTIMEDGIRKNHFLNYDDVYKTETIKLSFTETNHDPEAIHMQLTADTFYFSAPYEVTLFDMINEELDTFPPHQYHAIHLKKLYSFQGKQIVFTDTFLSAQTKIISMPHGAGSQGANAILFEVEYEGTSREVAVFGASGMISAPSEVRINNTKISIGYGSKPMTIPFSVHLVDFQLERYPGSMSPSSFKSDVIVMDEREKLEMPYEIYMNNVLNYGGFRFFQSSYDKDEKGTILSVNHDKWGTIITYIGYFILTLGLSLNFFSPSSRFRYLAGNAARIRDAARKSSASMILIALVSAFSITSQAQELPDPASHTVIEKAHAAEFGSLLVQGHGGRIKPINTLSSEILRKVYRKNSLEGLNSDQVLLGLLVDPGQWQGYPMIKVSNSDLKNIIGSSGKYASFFDFINEDGSYKLSKFVDEAYNKKPAERDAFDKDIMAVDERVNVIYMVYTGEFLNIFPLPNDPNNKWYTAHGAAVVFDSVDAGFIKNILPLYYGSVSEAMQSGDWSLANEYLGYLKIFQNKYGSDVMPANSKTKLEILYNKVNIFKRLFPIYSLLGLILLILVFARVLNPKLSFRWVIIVLVGLIATAFLLHTAGLGIRWYIAGRAPWSNGYETMIYISWGILLSGFIFIKNSKITLATTAILASITLMVANMSWLNPEITNLVPVLKSYWLVIHVAVITASYSFLAIGALLGFLNLLLINLVNAKNKGKIRNTIEELTNIIEMNLIIGVFLITIGTFLGAVWANESWGRYWGWDPKEAWALITVLVYSFVVHMRLIPGLGGNFSFNFASLISFSTVLMTYFGVNYFLSGMHSYAKGDPIPIPSFVYWAILIIAVVSVMAYRNYRKVLKQ